MTTQVPYPESYTVSYDQGFGVSVTRAVVVEIRQFKPDDDDVPTSFYEAMAEYRRMKRIQSSKDSSKTQDPS